MDEQKKPRAREKHVVDGTMKVEKHGDGLGTGPVGNTGGYQERREQEAARPQRTANGQQPFAQRPPQPTSPFGGQQRPSQTNPFTQKRPQQSNPFAARPTGSSPQGSYANGQKQYNSAVKQNGTGGGQKAGGTGVGQRMNGTGGQRAPGGGCSKYLLIIVALVVLLGGGKLTGLFDGNGGDVSSTLQQVATGGTGTSSQTGSSQTNSSQNSGPGDLLSGGTIESGGLSNLLNSFLGSSGSSVYDTGYFSSLVGGLTGSGNSESSTSSGSSGSISQYFTSSGGENSTSLDESVSKKARDKFTRIRGNNRDTVTIMVYMCGADLESQQGMATSDLKDMASAKLG